MQIQENFSPYGQILKVEIGTPSFMRPKFALITFVDVECAKKAVVELHSAVIKEDQPPLTVRLDNYNGQHTKKEKNKKSKRKIKKGQEGYDEAH